MEAGSWKRLSRFPLKSRHFVNGITATIGARLETFVVRCKGC